MPRFIIAIALLPLAFTAGHARPAAGTETNNPDYLWIVGTWRSYELEYGDFAEWHRAVKVELVASSPEEIDLFLILDDGRRVRAYDSEPCVMHERTLFFGPIGSGLSFRYRRPTKDTLVLDI